MRALIVDDDAQLQELFGDVLAQGEFEISSCHEGQAALDLLATTRFDVVVLDLLIPRPHGLTVLAHLRSTAGPNRSTPVIVCTGVLMRGDRRDESPIQGADAVLAKPVEPRELLQTALTLAGRPAPVA